MMMLIQMYKHIINSYGYTVEPEEYDDHNTDVQQFYITDLLTHLISMLLQHLKKVWFCFGKLILSIT